MGQIEVKNLRKTFRVRHSTSKNWVGRTLSWFKPEWTEVAAVRDLSFNVERGETVAFLGPNGAGKSTTIKILTGILHPTSGEVNVLGFTPWTQRKALSYRIGTVFGQRSQLWMHLPPTHTFDLLARAYELPDSLYQKNRTRLISTFELNDLLHIPVRKLSLGQRMRCEIAASLLHSPEVLFLDEPTIGLDPVAKNSIRDLITRANQETGVTVFLTSHDTGDIEHLCRRVVIINQGAIVLDDSLKRLQRDYLRVKEIDLKLDEPYSEGSIQIPGVQILKHKGYGVKLSVDPEVTPIHQVISQLLQRFSIQDIVIQNPEMERIIADIYRGQKPGQSFK